MKSIPSTKAYNKTVTEFVLWYINLFLLCIILCACRCNNTALNLCNSTAYITIQVQKSVILNLKMKIILSPEATSGSQAPLDKTHVFHAFFFLLYWSFFFILGSWHTNKVPGFPVDISRGFSPSFALNLLWKKKRNVSITVSSHSILIKNKDQVFYQ